MNKQLSKTNKDLALNAVSSFGLFAAVPALVSGLPVSGLNSRWIKPSR